MAAIPLHLLLVEDCESDAALIARVLVKAGYDVTHCRVESGEAFSAALAERDWDIVISDYNLPQFDAGDALALLRESGRDLPFIVVSGTIGEETAVALMRAGARDYVLKSNLVRLPPAVSRELAEAETRRRRRENEDALRESEARFSAFASSTNDAIVTADEAGLIREWNAAAQRMFGYAKEEIVGRSIDLIIPSRHRYAHGQAMACIQKDGDRAPDHLRRIGGAVEVAGARRDGSEFPIEISISAWRLGREGYFSAIIRDIGERIEAQRQQIELARQRDLARQDREEHLKTVQNALEDVVQAIATALEYRDAYTAGHQRRVAGLAVAIARELGLPEDRIRGIRLASVAHDIGKIQVPSEILAKPTRLHKAELELIRLHPQVGFDILKDIEFPWPIAQAVLQHHERMDGSGYPNGLSGDAILLEARIIGVSDVVEAMASHRPYRPGHGIDRALAEITEKRDTHYDAVVVDACVRLFHQGGYRLDASMQALL